MKLHCRICDSITKHYKRGLSNTINICSICGATNMPVTLIKSNGETHYGTQVKFIEWSGEELGSRAKQLHDEPQVGYSCIIDPQYSYQYTWLTTPITAILNIGIGKECTTYQFKTENSEYTLHTVKADE